MSPLAIRFAITLLLVTSACHRSSGSNNVIRIAAASDLTNAFREVSDAFQARTGHKVLVDYGASGNLATQVAAGAGYNVFASADASYIDKVVASGKCNGATREIYAMGRVAMWVKSGPAPVDLAALADPRYQRIAIANPEHAPYGRAAREALIQAGMWDSLQPRLIIGENVRQTLQYAERGDVDVAIVAHSLTIGAGGAATLISASAHKLMAQTLVLCGGSTDKANPGAEFTAFLRSAEGRTIMSRFGFELPPPVAP